MAKIARKKYQEALKALKQACKNERLPFALRIRAAELICGIYGVPLPESTARTRRTVRELVSENAFDKHTRNQVREKARQDAEAAKDAKRSAYVKALFDEVLSGTSSQQEAAQSSSAA
jgi:hypothetical protein